MGMETLCWMWFEAEFNPIDYGVKNDKTENYFS